jgi:hypothetical protein
MLAARQEIWRWLDLHDRYMIVDDQRAIHLGASIKDFGRKMTELQELSMDPIKQLFATLWASGTPVT